MTAGQFQWQWVKLDLGQTLLIKRRCELPEVKEGASFRTEARSRRSQAEPSGRQSLSGPPAKEEESARPPDNVGDWRREYAERTENVLKTVDYLQPRIGDEATIGRVLKKVAQNGTPAEFAGVASGLYGLLCQAPSVEGGDAPHKEPSRSAKSDTQPSSEDSLGAASLAQGK